MSRLAAALLLIVLAAAPSDNVSQAPQRDAAEPKPATAVIRGRVLAADTGAPLRRARVTLSAPNLPSQRTVDTDLEGRYEFADLPAGRYRVKAAKGQFVPLEFGQRRAFEAGRTIDLADAVTLEKVDLALPRGGVISGRIVDDLGDPVAWVRVSAMRPRYEEGVRKLIAVGRSATTNDLGEYRLYGLAPGTYAVGTIPDPGLSAGGYAYAPAYYPGTRDPAQARNVIVGLSQERGGVDFVQPPGYLATVSGILIDSRGRSLAGARVNVVDIRIGSILVNPVNPDGTFTIADVAPGEYALAGYVPDPVSGGLDFVMVPLVVSGDDISGAVVRFVPGSRIAGRVITENGGVPPFAPARPGVGVTLLPSGLPMRYRGVDTTGLQGAVTTDGTFELTGVAGSALFRIGKLPQGWMLKSVRLDGRDITDTPLDIDGTEEITGLQVVVTDRVTEVTGTVSDEKDERVQEYAVVVFAEEASRRAWPSRFVATARPDQAGTFKISNLPPAQYLVAALDYLEEGASQDPEFLESLRSKATRLALGEGERVALQLRLVRLEGPPTPLPPP